MSELSIRNRQRTKAINVPLLRRITRHLLEQELDVVSYELGFHIVEADEMEHVNKKFLQHEGSTDVITFDYGSQPVDRRLHGEVLICIADAVKQGEEFRTTWQSEVVRYLIHGLLHLNGYDDLEPAKRRLMKREENRLSRRVGSMFPLDALARPHQS